MSMIMITNALKQDLGRPKTGFSTLLIILLQEVIR